MPEALAAVLDAESHVLRLSVADANALASQRATDVPPLDPKAVQSVMDTGSVEHADQSGVTIRGALDGKPWRAVLRRAADALGALYLAAFGPADRD